jgi:Kef-type K+ transport system membrane component KefB/nucleotide-binding universal stress UspA family protein
MEPFAGIAHEDLLKLVLSVALLLGAARLLGGLMERLKQPAVIGEIMAGVILGPSVLGGIFPAFGRLVVPQTLIQSQLLDVVALIGVMTLILMVGMETDLGLIRARIKSATAVGLGGLVIPFAFGLALGNWLPDSLMGPASNRAAFNMFLAVALALSAIPVLAKILSDLRLLRSEFGQTALAAGMIDDVLGWTLLGLVTSLATAGVITFGDVAATLGAVVAFIVATIVVIGPLTRWSLDVVLDRVQIRDRVLTLVIVIAFAWGAFTKALHLEPILGAFAVGMMFGRLRRLPVETGRQLESLTYAIFAPVFLATAGLRLDIGVLFQADLLWITVAMLATAAAGKLIGSFVGARYFGGIETRHAAAYGVALNARGVLGVIVASIGLSMGIFGVELYTMLVVVSLVTSVMAPVGLRYLMKSESETTVSGKPSLTLNRILAPVRLREEGSPASFDPSILGSFRGDSPAVTLMTVVEPADRRSAAKYLTDLAEQVPDGLEVTKRVVTGDPVESIVGESAKGYDLVFLGAPEPSGGPDYLFEATLDEIVRLVACPSVIFSSRGSHWPPVRIMVPTGGAGAASRAADLAFALSGEESQVLLFHAIDPESSTSMSMSKQTAPGSRLEVGQGVVSALRAVGEGIGVSVATEVVMGTGVVDSILERASQEIDLLILGTNVRAGSHRLYLGSKVERLLVEAPCSTIVFNV